MLTVMPPTPGNSLSQRISSWLAHRRAIRRERLSLPQCGSDLADLARDVGLSSPAELMSLVANGPHSAELLDDMAATLNIPLASLKATDAGLVRVLQVNCSRCGDKGRCVRELKEETAALTYHAFCPNAEALDTLRS